MRRIKVRSDRRRAAARRMYEDKRRRSWQRQGLDTADRELPGTDLHAEGRCVASAKAAVFEEDAGTLRPDPFGRHDDRPAARRDRALVRSRRGV